MHSIFSALHGFTDRPARSARPQAHAARALAKKLLRALKPLTRAGHFGDAARIPLVHKAQELTTLPNGQIVPSMMYWQLWEREWPDRPTYAEVLQRLDAHLWEIIVDEPPLKGARGKQALALHVAYKVVDYLRSTSQKGAPHFRAATALASAVTGAEVDERSVRDYCQRQDEIPIELDGDWQGD